jgi:RimJ/RimL family protein N-acetyltransferase
MSQVDPSSSEPEPILNVVGERVALGPMRRDLLQLYSRWANDFKVMGTVTPTLRPLPLESEQAWYDRAVDDEQLARFTIYVREKLRPVGTTSLFGIHHGNRTATFGILIGEQECWNRGYGTEATRLMLDYGFTALGLHNIMLCVRSWNVGGIRAYERAGFKEIGRRREAIRVGGRAYDEVFMDCLACEFQSPVLGGLLLPETESAH